MFELERDESNGRDDQHHYYRVLRDEEPVTEWLSWAAACEVLAQMKTDFHGRAPSHVG